MSFNNPDNSYFDKILQQVGAFPFTEESSHSTPLLTPGNSKNKYLEMDEEDVSGNRALTPSSEEGSKSPTNINNTKRKYHNKSRNGCATCKKRRVKCDERHPICSKCEHMKIECVYLPVEPKIRRKKKEILAERARNNSNGNNIPIKQENDLFKHHKRDTRQSQQQHQQQQQQQHHHQHQQQQQQQHHHQQQQILQSVDQSIPSINVNDFDDDTNSTNYTPSAISERGNSIHSFASSQSSPLSDTAVKQELHHHHHHHHHPSISTVSGIPPHFAEHSRQSSVIPQQFQNYQEQQQQQQQQQQIQNQQQQQLLQQQRQQHHHLQNQQQQQHQQLHQIVKPQDQQTNIPKVENTLMTPLQIQKKIQRAQEYQKERVKQFQEYATKSEPNLTPSVSSPSLVPGPLNSFTYSGNLNILDLRLMYHYTTKVWPTITAAGISEERIWSEDIPKLAFSYPFLMHSILAFSATHLSRTERGLDQCVTCHRGDALRLLREAVLEISPANTDALVASALILIMDSLANASLPTSSSPKSLPASAWIFHVKGALTILTAVWPLNENSRFYKFIGVDLGDLGDIINSKKDVEDGDDGSSIQQQRPQYSDLECFDAEIADLYPVSYDSPYLITLAYLNKLHSERYKSDFILRIFAFPALLDKTFLGLLITGDISAMRIMRCYYSLLRSFTTEMKDKVWFLEGVSNVLPVDVEQYSGGGGMNMMMDFLGGPATLDMGGEDDLESYSEVGNGLLNPDNLPSSITNTMDVMQGDNDFI